MLCDVFGFQHDGRPNAQGARLSLGDQSLWVVKSRSVAGAIGLHHLALSVPDTDMAMQECLNRGGRLAASMTPDGPLEIAAFWDTGVRYVFFEGPEGVLIELCMRIGQPAAVGWGHDHLGVRCADIAATAELFQSMGCRTVAQHSLDRPGGPTLVTFLRYSRSTIELFCEPGDATRIPASPHLGWVGCALQQG